MSHMWGGARHGECYYRGCCCVLVLTMRWHPGPGHCSTVNFAPGASVRIFAVVIILMSHKACIYVSSCKMKTPIYSYLRIYSELSGTFVLSFHSHLKQLQLVELHKAYRKACWSNITFNIVRDKLSWPSIAVTNSSNQSVFVCSQ